MARETGDLLKCVEQARYHILPHKARLLVMAGALSGTIPEKIQARFKLVDIHLETIEAQVKKIKTAADKGDIEAIKQILDEKVGIGHDFETVQQS